MSGFVYVLLVVATKVRSVALSRRSVAARGDGLRCGGVRRGRRFGRYGT
jgi:hypothetical protein